MKTTEKLGFLNLAVVILSLYVLFALLIDTIWHLPDEISIMLNYFDDAICVFFFIEFVIRFRKAENKLAFMKWGWIDLVAAIPMIDPLRAGRVFRLIRIIRIYRAYTSLKELLDQLLEHKMKGAFYSFTLLSFLIMIFSAITILIVEVDPNSNIKTAEDAIWWTYTTITTVGYGDKYPVTTAGRFLGMLLMTFGVGLFGAYTAYIASLMVKDKGKS
jgi:voltage-gated potassium channel